MKKTGAEIFVDSLVKEKVDVIFGYPGGVLIPIFDVLYDSKKINVVLTRHEQGAAHAADGYARATGKVGVCLATSGPGATNIVTGVATAYLDSIPMVAITGQVATPLLGTDAFQEADLVGITRPITKHNYLVKDVKDLPRILKEAFHIAKTGRPGPVLVDIPKDVTTSFLNNYEYPKKVDIRSYKPNVVGHINQIKKAAKAIKAAKKPLIYAGGGIILSGAHKELKKFAEKTNIPVFTTLMGIGGFPGEHKLNLGMPGMHGSEVCNRSIQESDLLISIGARFDDRVTGNVKTFAPKAKIIHMDIDPAAISKIIQVDIPVVGDAKNILTQLIDIIEPGDYKKWVNHVMEMKGDKLYTYKQSEEVIKPQYVIEELYKETKGKAIISTEVGQHQMWAAHYYLFEKPMQWLTSGGLGTMGFGLPAAMGASLVRKEPVWNIAGDGSIQMNIQELATIAINKIPVKTVILNNSYLGMVRQWQDLFFDKRYSSVCLDASANCDGCGKEQECADKNEHPYIPDFVKLAESYGITAFRATKPSEVKEVLKKANAIDGPVVLEFLVDKEENVFPMVPAGAPIDEMILEDK